MVAGDCRGVSMVLDPAPSRTTFDYIHVDVVQTIHDDDKAVFVQIL